MPTVKSRQQHLFPCSMEQLVQYINAREVTGIRTKAGFFADVPELKFSEVGFTFWDNDINPRVENDTLLLDLWFDPRRTTNKGVLEERISVYGERLVKQAIAIKEIDYVVGISARYYW